MMRGNGSYLIFKTPEGQVVPNDVWEGGKPDNDHRTSDYLNQSDETASAMKDGKVYDIRETCSMSLTAEGFNCSVVCQTSSPTGNSVLLRTKTNRSPVLGFRFFVVLVIMQRQ